MEMPHDGSGECLTITYRESHKISVNLLNDRYCRHCRITEWHNVDSIDETHCRPNRFVILILFTSA